MHFLNRKDYYYYRQNHFLLKKQLFYFKVFNIFWKSFYFLFFHSLFILQPFSFLFFMISSLCLRFILWSLLKPQTCYVETKKELRVTKSFLSLMAFFVEKILFQKSYFKERKKLKFQKIINELCIDQFAFKMIWSQLYEMYQVIEISFLIFHFLIKFS